MHHIICIQFVTSHVTSPLVTSVGKFSCVWCEKQASQESNCKEQCAFMFITDLLLHFYSRGHVSYNLKDTLLETAHFYIPELFQKKSMISG